MTKHQQSSIKKFLRFLIKRDYCNKFESLVATPYPILWLLCPAFYALSTRRQMIVKEKFCFLSGFPALQFVDKLFTVCRHKFLSVQYLLIFTWKMRTLKSHLGLQQERHPYHHNWTMFNSMSNVIINKYYPTFFCRSKPGHYSCLLCLSLTYFLHFLSTSMTLFLL